MKHIFAISAYRESPYLEECLKSLKRQTSESEVILCTSTPSDFLEKITAQYGIPCYVRDGEPGLKEDWNFCLETAEKQGATLVTIAHQDDVYLPGYGEAVIKNADDDTLLVFTAAGNIDAMGVRINGKAEKVKRILRGLKRKRKKTCGKKALIAYGNSIPCPACTYNVQLTGTPLFKSDKRFVIDWETLFELSERKGSFIYVAEPLVDIRLHEGSETKKTMGENLRAREELYMFRKFHIKPVARLLMRFYGHSSQIYDNETLSH